MEGPRRRAQAQVVAVERRARAREGPASPRGDLRKAAARRLELTQPHRVVAGFAKAGRDAGPRLVAVELGAGLVIADLTAFLTSFHPSRDHVPTARALLSLGVDSLSRIVELLALEPSSLELLCAQLRKEGALGALDVAWLKKVVGLAREACARGE